MTTKTIDDKCDDNNAAEQSTVASCAAMACRKEEINFVFTLCFLKKIIFFLYNYYKGNSLHDYNLKNTQDYTT